MNIRNAVTYYIDGNRVVKKTEQLQYKGFWDTYWEPLNLRETVIDVSHYSEEEKKELINE